MIRICDKQLSLLCLERGKQKGRGVWEELQKGWEIIFKTQKI